MPSKSASKKQEQERPPQKKIGKNFHFVAAMAKKGKRAYDGMDGGGAGLQGAASGSQKARRNMAQVDGAQRRRMSYAESDGASTVGRSRGEELPSTTPVGSYINGVLGGKLHPALVDNSISGGEETNDSEPEPEDEPAADAEVASAEDGKIFARVTADKIAELRAENLKLQERLQTTEQQLKEVATQRRPASQDEKSQPSPETHQNGTGTRLRPAAVAGDRSMAPLAKPSRTPSPSPSPLPLALVAPTFDGELAQTERRVQVLEESALRLKRRLAGVGGGRDAADAETVVGPSVAAMEAVSELRQSAAALLHQLENGDTGGSGYGDREVAAQQLGRLVERNEANLRRLQLSDEELLRHLVAAGAHLRECAARIESGLRAELATAKASALEAAAAAATRERRLSGELQRTRRQLTDASAELTRARADEAKRADSTAGLTNLLAVVGAENRGFQRRLVQLAESVQRDSMAGPDAARQLRDLATYVRTDFQVPSAAESDAALGREVNRLQVKLQDSEARCDRLQRDLQRLRREQRLAVKKLSEWEAELYCARQEAAEANHAASAAAAASASTEAFSNGGGQQQTVRRQSQVHLAALIEHIDLVESSGSGQNGGVAGDGTPTRATHTGSNGAARESGNYYSYQQQQQQQQQQDVHRLVHLLLSNGNGGVATNDKS